MSDFRTWGVLALLILQNMCIGLPARGDDPMVPGSYVHDRAYYGRTSFASSNTAEASYWLRSTILNRNERPRPADARESLEYRENRHGYIDYIRLQEGVFYSRDLGVEGFRNLVVKLNSSPNASRLREPQPYTVTTDLVVSGRNDLLQDFLRIPGIDVNQRNEDYRQSTPLMVAAETGNTEAIRILGRRGADVNLAESLNPDLAGGMSVPSGVEDRFQVLNSGRFRPGLVPFRTWASSSGNSPLMIAAYQGHDEAWTRFWS